MDYLPNTAVKAEAQKLLRVLVKHALARTTDIASTIHSIHLSDTDSRCVNEWMKDISKVSLEASGAGKVSEFSPLSQWWMDESETLHYEFTPSFAQFVSSLCKKTRMMSLIIPTTDTLH